MIQHLATKYTNHWRASAWVYRSRATILGLSAFAGALILPFIAVCALVGLSWVRAEERRLTSAMASVADVVANDASRFLEDRLAILHALSTSPALDHDDFARFEQQVRELSDQNGMAIFLRDASGHVHVPTSAEGAPKREKSLVPVATSLNGLHVSDLLDGGNGETPVVQLDVPVLSQGRTRFIVSAVLSPSAFDDVLRRSGLSGDQFGTIVDGHGRVIGRSATSQMTVGQVVQGFAQRTGQSGLWTGRNKSGRDIRVEYRRLAGIGWLVNVGMTEAALRAPLSQSIWMLAALSVALVLGAFLLTLPIVYRMLADRRALDDASQLLLVAQQAAGAGAWDWDIRTDRVSLSPINARLHGLVVPQDAGAASIVLSVKQWEERVFAEDLPKVWEAVMDGVGRGTTLIRPPLSGPP